MPLRPPIPFRPLQALATLALSALMLLLLTPGARASFDSIPSESLVTNGAVEAMAVSGETLYLGGQFSMVGPRTGLGVPFNSDLSTRDTAVPQVSGLDGVIYTAISDGAGGWYVGGKFTNVGGFARSDLVHILANNTVDPSFTPEPNGAVRELALSGSTLYVGGQFEKIGGQTRDQLAALETSTGAATSFNPLPESDAEYEGQYLCGLAVDGPYIFVCGAFAEIGGQKRNGLALLNASDGSVTAWNPENRDRPESMYLAPGGMLYLGIFGEFLIEPTKENRFHEPKRVDHDSVAALKLAPEVTAQPEVLAFNPSFGTPGFFYEAPVTSFLQIGSTLYIGGRLTSTQEYGENENGEDTFSEEAHDRVVAYDTADNYAVVPFEPSPNGEVTALAAVGEHLYLAGNFSEVGGVAHQGLVEVNASTAAVESSNPEIDGRVGTLATTESKVYVGGSITTVGGATREHLAAIDTATGALEEADPAVDGTVRALAVDGSTLYVGGSFRNATGALSGEESKSRPNLAAFETGTGALTSFDPEPNNAVNALALSGSTLFAGGSFGELGTTKHGTLAAFSTTDGSTEAFNPEPNGEVHALEVTSGRLYAAGSFSELAGLSGTPKADDLAAFELPGETLDASFNSPSFDGSLFSVAADGTSVYVGGDFNDVGETYEPRLVALSAADGALETSWNPEASNDVDSLLLDGSTLYAGGAFGDAGGLPRPGVAGLSTESGAATAFDPEPEGEVRALALGTDALYIGGSFTEVGCHNQSYFATFASGSPAEEETLARSGCGGSGSGESGSEGSSAGSTALGSTPSTFITTGPSYYTTARQETFDFASDVAGASFRCSIDGGAAFACSSPYTTGTLALGAHRFVVQAVEPSGTVDPAGASESFVVIEPSAVASSSVEPAPVLSHVKLPARIARTSATKKHKKLAPTILSFSSSEAAKVTITLRRIVRVACPAHSRHRNCTALRAAGTITIAAHAGSNRVVFSGRVRGKPLSPGRYTATLVARNAAALASKPLTVSFQLVGRA
jgi:trimeric autotransporter adhesin